MSLKIYWNPGSPSSRAVCMALANLEIEAEMVLIDLMKGEHLEESYLQLNPLHTIPTMDDDGFILIESKAIMTYLANTRAAGSNLYPEDPKQRALVDQRLFYDSSTFTARYLQTFTPIIFGGESTIPDANMDKLNDSFDKLELFLDNCEWLAGDELTLADLSIFSILSTEVEAGIDISSFTKLSEWYERMLNIPGAEQNMEGAQLLGGLIKSRME